MDDVEHDETPCRAVDPEPGIHVFECDFNTTTGEPFPTPRDRRCLCGKHTWGWMDDQLAFEKMMDPTTPDVRPA